MYNLIVGFLELQLSSKELKLSVALGLYSCNLLLLSCLPHFVEVSQELVHQGWLNLTGALVSEGVCYLECLFWYPLLELLPSFEVSKLGSTLL